MRLLSGGNQQKVVIAKWLFRDSRVLFFDEPTRGIDVGAKYAIYKLLDELAAQGIGVVLISSELPEILGMTDRVAVFHAGRLRTRARHTRDQPGRNHPARLWTTLLPHDPMNDKQKDLFQKFAALASLFGLTIVFAFVSDAFLSLGNGMTVALQVTSIAYLGIGATCVIITGGIDLSVGAILALSGVVAALAVKAGAPVPAGMLAGLLVGALCGARQRRGRHLAAPAALHRDAGHDAGGARRGAADHRRARPSAGWATASPNWATARCGAWRRWAPTASPTCDLPRHPLPGDADGACSPSRCR